MGVHHLKKKKSKKGIGNGNPPALYVSSNPTFIMELQQPLHHQYDSYFVREIIDFYSLLSTDKTDHIFVYFHKVITTAMKKKKKKRTPKQKQPYYLCFDDDLTEELFTTLRTRCIILNKNKPFFDSFYLLLFAMV